MTASKSKQISIKQFGHLVCTNITRLGQLVYTVNCKGKCNERFSTDDYLRIHYALIPKDLWEWQLHVSRDRFEKALRDLSTICPGVKSTY